MQEQSTAVKSVLVWTAVKRASGRFTVWSLAFAFANGMENVSQAG